MDTLDLCELLNKAQKQKPLGGGEREREGESRKGLCPTTVWLLYGTLLLTKNTGTLDVTFKTLNVMLKDFSQKKKKKKIEPKKTTT